MTCIADGFGYSGAITGHALDGDGAPIEALGNWQEMGPQLRAWDAGRQQLVADAAHSNMGEFFTVTAPSGVAFTGEGDSWPLDGGWRYVTFVPPTNPSAGMGCRLTFGTCWFQGKYEIANGTNGLPNDGSLVWVLRLGSAANPVGNIVGVSVYSPPNPNYPAALRDYRADPRQLNGPVYIANWLGLRVGAFGAGNVDAAWGVITSPMANTNNRPGLILVNANYFPGCAIGSPTYAATGVDVVLVNEEMSGNPAYMGATFDEQNQCPRITVTRAAAAPSGRSPVVCLLTRIQPNGTAYFAMMRPGHGSYSFGIISPQFTFALMGGGTMPALAVGDSGVFGFSARDGELAVYWNEQLQSTHADEQLSGGKVGYMQFLAPNAGAVFDLSGENRGPAMYADAPTFYCDHFRCCSCTTDLGCENCTQGAHLPTHTEAFAGADTEEIDGRRFNGADDGPQWLYTDGPNNIGIIGGKGVNLKFEATSPVGFTLYRIEQPTVDPVFHGLRQTYEIHHLTAALSELAVYVHYRDTSGNAYRVRALFNAAGTTYKLERILNGALAAELGSWAQGPLSVGAHTLELRASCADPTTVALDVRVDGVEMGGADDSAVLTGSVALGILDQDTYFLSSGGQASVLLTSTAILGCGSDTELPCVGPPENPYPHFPPPITTPLPATAYVRRNVQWVTVPASTLRPRRNLVARALAADMLPRPRRNLEWRDLLVDTEGTFPEPETPQPPFIDPCNTLVPLPPSGPVLPLTGRFFGLSNSPVTVLGPLFNGCKRTIYGGTPSELSVVASRNSVMMGAQGSYPKFLLNGRFDADYFLTVTMGMLGPVLSALQAATAAGTFFGYSFIDDFDSHSLWPPTGVSDAQMFYIVEQLHARCPGIRIGLRGRPSQFPFNPGIDFYGTQYVSWKHGAAFSFGATEYAIARSRNSYVTLDLNYIAGGNGSSGIPTPNGRPGWYYCSAAEVVSYLTGLFQGALSVDGTAAKLAGSLGYQYREDFLAGPGIIAALGDGRNVLAQLPPP